MRLGLVTAAVALAWALASGRRLDPRLPRVRWAMVGVLGLVGQAALDWFAPTGQVQVAGEALSLAALLATCLVNPRLPGIVALTAGVVSNALVILANAGMPVSPTAIVAVGGSPGTLPGAGHHHVLDVSTRLPVLADTLGLGWLGIVVSPGDALLVAGTIVLLRHALVGDVHPDPRLG